MLMYKNVIQVVNSLNTSSLEYNTVLVNITQIVVLVAVLIISASNFICQQNYAMATMGLETTPY